jgi:capsule polysaccharide export protein KpsE/RkpR
MVKKTQSTNQKLQVSRGGSEDNDSKRSSPAVSDRKKSSVLEELFKLVGKSATIIIVISFCYWGFYLYKTLVSPMIFSTSSPATETDAAIKVTSAN